MRLSVYGAGYVGLVAAVCFAELGHEVLCYDIDAEKIAALQQGDCILYEAHLATLLQRQLGSGRLHFTTDFTAAVCFARIHSIAVGTPQAPDGSADLSQVEQVVLALAECTKEDCVIVIKSTVPVGTGNALQQKITQLQRAVTISCAANPEFLREGTAVADFMHPDRIILGGEENALQCLQQLYQPLVAQGIPLLLMSRQSAELSKYAANVMLANRISMVNYFSQLAERLGANIEEVTQTLALDKRIGPHYLQAGIGYGGSCFPKDIQALIATARQLALNSDMLTAIAAINTSQKHWVINHMHHHFAHGLQDVRIGVWGLAFKPDTDDMREASSLTIIADLTAAGAQLWVYDPKAMPAAKRLLQHSNIHWCETAHEVLDAKLQGLVIATEWQEFKQYSLQQLQQKLGNAPVWDGRNCFSLAEIAQSGLTYYSVGRMQKECDAN